MNLVNYGVVTGRVTKDPMIYTHSDGSRKVKVTVAAADNFISGPNKEKQTRFIPVEAFIPATKQGNGVYELIGKGDLIMVGYSVRNNHYIDKNGEQQFNIVLNVEEVQLLESKSVTDKRKADRVVE